MAYLPFNPERLRIPVLKRVLPSLLKRWAKLTTPGGFRVTSANGMRFLVRCDNYVDRHILYYGEFEAEQTRYMGALVKARGVDLFIDVGANFGYYTVLAATKWGIDEVISLEPDPRNFLQLGANVLLNGLIDRVQRIEIAASDIDGETGFLMSKDQATGCSHIIEGDAQTHVLARRLDDLIPATGRKIAFKIDVEGYELHVLRGMTRLLRENACVLHIESFEEKRSAVTALLAELGYAEIHAIGPDRYFAPRARAA